MTALVPLLALAIVGAAVLVRRAAVAAAIERDAREAAAARREHARWVAAQVARQIAREEREDRELVEALRQGGWSPDTNGDA